MGRRDLDKYMPLVSAFDISDGQKRELLEAVWRIAQSFVDRAYNIDSAQISVQKRFAESSENPTDSLYLGPPHRGRSGLEGGPE